MGKFLVPALIIGAIFLFTRRSSAATSSAFRGGETIPPLTGGGTSSTTTRTGGGSVPNYGQVNPMNPSDVAAGWEQARNEIDRDFNRSNELMSERGTDFNAYPAPIPPRMIAVVMARESDGRDVTSTIGEQGFMQISPDELRSVGGGNPHDFRDSIRVAQKLYQNAINRNPQTTSEDQLFVALCSRSIGPGATRWLLSRVPAGEGRTTDRVQAWLTTSPERPVGIRQSDKKFTLRIARALLRADRAEREGLIASDGLLPTFA